MDRTVRERQKKTMPAGKKQVAERVARKLAVSQEAAMGFVTAVVNAQRETIVEDGGLQMRGLGTFRVVQHAESRARNPRTQETVVVPAHGRVKFRAGTELRLGVRDLR